MRWKIVQASPGLNMWTAFSDDNMLELVSDPTHRFSLEKLCLKKKKIYETNTVPVQIIFCVNNSDRHVILTPTPGVLVSALQEVAEFRIHPAKCWGLVENEVSDPFYPEPSVEIRSLSVKQEMLLIVVEHVSCLNNLNV